MDIGLVYMRARYYLPGVGRFVSADTIVPDPDDPQSFNRYSYVRNNPIGRVDPTGHQDIAEEFAGGGTGSTPLPLSDTSISGGNIYIAEIGVLGRASGSMVRRFIPGVSDDLIDDIIPDDNLFTPGALPTQPVGGDFFGQVRSFINGVRSTVRQFFRGNTSSAEQPCSFSADTVVKSEDGSVPIAELEEGDYVLAYNEETGEIGYYPIVATWYHEDPVVIYLTIEGETIITTPEHPFYTEVGKWVAAGQLQPGDEIRDASGDRGTVQSVHFVARPQTMYNLTVAIAHTYFVSDGQWLVHNDCGDSPELTPLPDTAVVCRGGTCTVDRFLNGSGVTVNPDGTLSNVSVNSGAGASLTDLTQTIPNGQVGVTTVGNIRAAGGQVHPDPTPYNPYHCLMCGLSPNVAESLFTPTILTQAV